jgi:hypothetical protein
MTGQFVDPRLLEELRRERTMIDDVLQAYDVFAEKLSRLPPGLIKRVSRMIGEQEGAGKQKPPSEATAANFAKIAQFLRAKSNVPQPAKAIAAATGLTPGTVAFLLYQSSYGSKLEKQVDPTNSRLKLWCLKEWEAVLRQEPESEGPSRGPVVHSITVNDRLNLEDSSRISFSRTSASAFPELGTPTSTRAQSLAGKTSTECARQILREHGRAMHVSAIAKEALRRGYVGRPTDAPIEPDALEHRIIQSFWAAMHRAPDLFEKTGSGCFILKRAEADSPQED